MSKRKIPEDEKQMKEDEPKAKIASIFIPHESHGTWKFIPDQLLIYTTDGIEHRPKIAGFDLDGTLIKTKSGAVFGKNSDDWIFWSDKVLPTLRKSHNDGYKLCIFTNQKGIQLKSLEVGQFKRKVQNICSANRLAIQVFVSIGSPNYRKPFTGMWERLESEENGGILVSRKESFYVGDAAGRLKSPIRTKNDHSCADRLFAINLALQFNTPEQFFTKRAAEEPYQLPEFNPSQQLETTIHPQFDPPDAQIPGTSVPELLLLVGPPASGKSTFAQRFRHDYTILSQDELGSLNECLKRAQKALQMRKSVIIDNTNRNIETRSWYRELASSLSIPIRCVHFDCTFSHALHNNTFRQIVGADRSHQRVNTIAIRTFFSAFQAPTLEEGFADIIRVNFVPDFESEEHRRVYGMYLVEK